MSFGARNDMSEAHVAHDACSSIRHRSANAAARRITDWLSLGATPTFAVMALLTIVGDGPQNTLCLGTNHASLLNGMGVMYVLMSAFHLAPWLKLVAGRPN